MKHSETSKPMTLCIKIEGTTSEGRGRPEPLGRPSRARRLRRRQTIVLLATINRRRAFGKASSSMVAKTLAAVD